MSLKIFSSLISGLWQVCFNGFEDIRHLYDTRFYGCRWVFTEDYYIIHDILLPDFFVWTQFLFSLCFTLLVIGSFLAALYLCCSRHHNKYLLLLWSTGTNLTISGIFGVIACLVFGGRLHYRDWMQNWEHNNPGWSYALACIGSLVLLAAGILFLVEARRFRKKIDRMIDEELKSQGSM